MRKHVFSRMAAIAALSVCSLIGARTTHAATASFPTKARDFRSWMVRAYDQCSPSGLSITGFGPSNGACLAANSTTDNQPPADALGATMTFSRLVVRRFPALNAGQGKIKLFGRGFQSGQRVKVRLTLRSTRIVTATKHPPAGNQKVTFADVTITCGNQNAGCFVGRPSGTISGSQLLSDCLTANGQSTGLAGQNVQIVDAALVNCDTNKVFAVPGILN